MTNAIRPDSVFNSFCLAVAGLLFGLATPINAWDVILDETFSGTGSFLASGSVPGFENPDWNIAGSSGNFATNGFGEDVYQVSGTGSAFLLDGVFRLTGTEAFIATAEFSNPNFVGSGSGFAFLQVTDSPDLLSLGVVQSSSGQYSASFAASVGGSTVGSGGFSLGTNVDQFTLMLEFEPDQINGGGIFNGFIDVNQSGNFMFLGTIDGTEYTVDALLNRNLFVGSTSFASSSTMSVEIDRLTISTNSAVPEPSSSMFVAVGLFASLIRRRR